MSMPYLTVKTGFLPSMVILAAALFASYVLHLMIAELAIKTEEGGQIISCLSRFLFRGKGKMMLTVVFFVLMALILCTNLAAYISGAEEIAVELLPVSGLVTKLIFYIVAAAVVLFGLKAVGVSEKIAVAVIFVLIGILAVASLFAEHHEIVLFGGTMQAALAYFGMAMFAMSAFFSVPQAVEGLQGDSEKVKKPYSLVILQFYTVCRDIALCADGIQRGDRSGNGRLECGDRHMGADRRRYLYDSGHADYLLVHLTGAWLHRSGADKIGHENLLDLGNTALPDTVVAAAWWIYGVYAPGGRSDRDCRGGHGRTGLPQCQK